ncbi:hypothetical protein MMC19_006461 [Ptychographa xylographoides]|nr:hypothetical protein [Ptychographa xylographoides]
MGAAVSVVQDQVKQIDGAKEKEGEVKEALENMRQMAQDQLEMFSARIRNKDHDAHLIPISKILNIFEYIQCTTFSKNNIRPAIKEAVSDFSHGPVADGLANLALSIIGRLLGESSIIEADSGSAISIDPLGGISRLDTFFFVYNFSSEGLIKTAKSVVACCIVMSSADVSQVDDKTLRVSIDQCFETSELELRKAIYGELRKALSNSKDP